MPLQRGQKELLITWCLLPSSVGKKHSPQCVCKTSTARGAHLCLDSSRHYRGCIECYVIYPWYVPEFVLPLLQAMQLLLSYEPKIISSGGREAELSWAAQLRKSTTQLLNWRSLVSHTAVRAISYLPQISQADWSWYIHNC